MALEGRDKPKQSLNAATADVGVGEKGSRAPNLAPLEVERSSWRVVGQIWAWGKVLLGEAARLQTWPGARRAWQMAGRSGAVCSVKEDLNTEGPALHPARGKNVLFFPRIRWQPLPRRGRSWCEPTVLSQLVPGTETVLGVFSVFWSWFSYLRSINTLQMLQTSVCALNSGGGEKKKKEELAWVMEQGLECCRWV